MKLDEFPDGTKVRRTTWRKDLYAIKIIQPCIINEYGKPPRREIRQVWDYKDNGKDAGSLSVNMLGYEDFEYYNKEEAVMPNVNFVGGEYNVVKVRLYNGNQSTYNFKIAADIPVEESMMVVVHSAKGYALAKVVTAYQNNFENALEVNKATAWVVNTVDNTDHANRIKATEKREYLLKQLEERKNAMEATAVYEALGSIDPVAKKLLQQLKKLI